MPITPSVFVAISLKHGLRLYAKTGIKPNRAWTPTAMLATASRITGKTFKRGEFLFAADHLERWIEEQKRDVPKGWDMVDTSHD